MDFNSLEILIKERKKRDNKDYAIIRILSCNCLDIMLLDKAIKDNTVKILKTTDKNYNLILKNKI